MSLQIGPDFVEVIDTPLDITKYTGLVADPSAGAISTFSGVTRNNFQGQAVVKLEYEAYVPMAVKKLAVGWVLASRSSSHDQAGRTPLKSIGYPSHQRSCRSQRAAGAHKAGA